MDKLLHNYSSIPVLKREFYETTIEVRARIDRYILQFYVDVFIYTWPNLDADLAKKKPIGIGFSNTRPSTSNI